MGVRIVRRGAHPREKAILAAAMPTGQRDGPAHDREADGAVELAALCHVRATRAQWAEDGSGSFFVWT